MQRWLWGYAGTVLAVGSIVVVQNIWDLDKNAWASWAQAIGTAGAVFAAVWVATNETRRRHAEALVAARITAAELGLRLVVDHERLIQIERLTKQVMQGQYLPNVLLNIQELLQGLTLSSKDEQLALIPLPNGVATSLSQANGRVHLALNQIGKLLSGVLADREGDRTMCELILKTQVEDLLSCLQTVRHECHLAITLNGNG